MAKKGGKYIGIAYDGAEVPVTDERAVKWFDTNTYKELTKEQALGMRAAQSNILKSVGEKSVAPGSPVRPARASAAVGLGRKRKTRRGKKSRKVTRRR
jgi:hypothetical protein